MTTKITTPKNLENYSKEIFVKTSPETVYDYLTNNVGIWWTTPKGEVNKIGDEATFHFPEGYWTMRVLDLVENSLVKWKCIKADHRVRGLSQNSYDEWVGTELTFKINQYENGSRINFTHEGLNPSLECFEVCNAGWNHFFVDILSQKLNEVITNQNND